MLGFGKEKTTTPKILMVEDAPTNHLMFRAAFEQKGFAVTICQTADGDFVEEVVQYQPDIISMDLMIGKEGSEVDRDGFQAIELLKADERTKDIPIIVLTNFFQADRVRQAKALGAADYLNLQAHSMNTIPDVFRRCAEDPKHYIPTHELFRENTATQT